MLKATITPNDLSDLGVLSINVYADQDPDLPLIPEIVKTRQELLSQGLIQGQTIVMNLVGYRPDLIYTIVLTPVNNNGFYVQDLTLNYPQ